jgi:hypothetical protein
MLDAMHQQLIDQNLAASPRIVTTHFFCAPLYVRELAAVSQPAA